jgi:hypothetical protein
VLAGSCITPSLQRVVSILTEDGCAMACGCQSVGGSYVPTGFAVFPQPYVPTRVHARCWLVDVDLYGSEPPRFCAMFRIVCFLPVPHFFVNVSAAFKAWRSRRSRSKNPVGLAGSCCMGHACLSTPRRHKRRNRRQSPSGKTLKLTRIPTPRALRHGPSNCRCHHGRH